MAAFGAAAEIGPVDLVVVALKTTSEGVRGLVEPLLGPATAILTLQNGLGADEFLAGLFGARRVIGRPCLRGGQPHRARRSEVLSSGLGDDRRVRQAA